MTILGFKRYQNQDLIYEFSAVELLTDDMPKRLRPEILEWLQTSPIGRWEYVYELGFFVGIVFEKQEDAALFKMVWF